MNRLLAVVLLCAGCNSVSSDPANGTETNWLTACVADDECGKPAACHCGLCTMKCDEDGDCAGIGTPARCGIGACGGTTAGICVADVDGNAATCVNVEYPPEREPDGVFERWTDDGYYEYYWGPSNTEQLLESCELRTASDPPQFHMVRAPAPFVRAAREAGREDPVTLSLCLASNDVTILVTPGRGHGVDVTVRQEWHSGDPTTRGHIQFLHDGGGGFPFTYLAYFVDCSEQVNGECRDEGGMSVGSDRTDPTVEDPTPCDVQLP